MYSMNYNKKFEGIWIPRSIWYASELTPLEKVILCEIHYLDNEDHCFASNAYLAELCCCSENKVSKAVNKLLKLGYISLISFDGRNRVLSSNMEFDVTVTKGIQKGCKMKYAELFKVKANNI